jgi:hypothetical protein
MGASKVWRVVATCGNARGVFDNAYTFGSDSVMDGTPADVAREVIALLQGLTREDCEAMSYGTNRFYLVFEVSQPRGDGAYTPHGADYNRTLPLPWRVKDTAVEDFTTDNPARIAGVVEETLSLLPENLPFAFDFTLEAMP